MPREITFRPTQQRQYCERDGTYQAPPPPRYIAMVTKPVATSNLQVSQNEQFFINNYGINVVKKAKDVAKNINCDWIDLIEVMYSLSGMDLKRYKTNKHGKIVGTVGLIQFTQITIDEINRMNPELKLTKEKLIKMSTVEQLTYVKKYYEMSKKKRRI